MLRIGMGQMLVLPADPVGNLKRATAKVAAAAAAGCRLVILPECLKTGWTDPSARQLAPSIPGAHLAELAAAAQKHNIYVVAGLAERDGDRIYNASVLLSSTGRLLLHHRKINELDIALPLYSVGQSLAVAETPFGLVGIPICADNFPDSRAIAESLARMGAQWILSPCSWAVDADHDNAKDPYGGLWLGSYGALACDYGLAVIGVSNVGPISAGPWAGRKCIGCSLAMAPSGQVLAQGPYGDSADALVVAEVEPRQAGALGTAFSQALAAGVAVPGR